MPVKSVEYDPTTKRIRVEFDREPAKVAPVVAASPAPAAPAGHVAEQLHADAMKFVPGTDIPDDNSPIDALALAMARPRYELDPQEATSGDRS